MILNLCVLTPNRTVWNSKVNEIILSNNSGQIGAFLHSQRQIIYTQNSEYSLDSFIFYILSKKIDTSLTSY